MGFGSYIGGLALCILAVLLAIVGLIVMLGFISYTPTIYNLPLGIVLLVMALFLFLYGRYLYQSSKPKGTINVHNV
jgi:hypothetical protein